MLVMGPPEPRRRPPGRRDDPDRIARGEDGRRPVYGSRAVFQDNPHWRDLVLFYEYFNGDTGEGLGASHQTGWTALVASLIDEWRRGYAPGEASRLAAQPVVTQPATT